MHVASLCQKWTHGMFLGCGIMVDRTTLHVPRDSKLWKIATEGDDTKPKWQKIEERITDREEWAVNIFEEFVARMSVLYPEKKDKLRDLRPLVLWQILDGQELTDNYYKKLKKL
ncbi:MAG: hypothetical protein MPEBLZ_03233 [Candidatus Methanoperedens nitroreducens]|uniref:Uncharacterized protein n=1 Tax=Candidatus Methanoperedens nitratireducens TaxID=1392998 RepID=A0A0P8ADI1_9EURY|nr:MAG: hypothetical protein MPEBLZ_03233 [Candidatus Methanoperedens sp. BLZ1]